MSVDPASAPLRPAVVRDGATGLYYKIGGSGGGGGSGTVGPQGPPGIPGPPGPGGSLDTIPPGVVLNVKEVAGTYTRPTPRTDLCVIFTGVSDPAAAAKDGDKWDQL